MFHGRRANSKINHIPERALRIVYKNNALSFEELLELKLRYYFKNLPTKSCQLYIFFSIRIFFTDTDTFLHFTFTGQQGKGGGYLLFHSITSTRSRTLRLLFATLHVRWLSRSFNRNACVNQSATRWDLPHYRITIWLIDWWCNVFLFTWWIDTRFPLPWFDIGNRWVWTRIDYHHPCFTSEPTNQGC